MKKVVCRFLCAVFLVCSFSGLALAEAPFHIGIVTPTVSQAEDNYRGAEALLKKYGDVADGGMVRHLTSPDNFNAEMETTITQIVSLADDPLMKVIVVDEAVPGTTEAFKRIMEKRPDIVRLAGNPLEDPNMICPVASLAVMPDHISRGYTIIYGAKEMGADTFVHISFPRHLSIELLSRRMHIMEEVCKDLGLKFVQETAPDPTSDVGVAGAQQYVLEKTPAWLEKYGKNACFFTTNQTHIEPLLRQLTHHHGGYFLEADSPSPLKGYPGAFHLDLEKEKGNWEAIMAKIEKAVVDAGAGGRLGTWAYSTAYATAAGLGEFGKWVVEGKTDINDTEALKKALETYTPGASWRTMYYTDKNTGVKMKNYLLIMQDSYVFGKGFLHLTDVEIPKKYYKIK
ncbi:MULTISPECIES: DUF3798 domain-containing protein [Aminobacterium]|jgi:hypothetical protein|uniref:DUF3798 domain-containing protein n=1 Tax=Aminobacterium TaxID=81466 RepID=UPI000465A29C|nr:MULTISPECIES: DUF3798 domain-containing protein [Aminobacterium]